MRYRCRHIAVQEPVSRSHEYRRRLDGGLLRGVERRAGVHARLSRRLALRQEEAIMAQICTRFSESYRGHKNSGSGSVVKLLMRDEVIVLNIAKLTELLRES